MAVRRTGRLVQQSAGAASAALRGHALSADPSGCRRNGIGRSRTMRSIVHRQDCPSSGSVSFPIRASTTARRRTPEQRKQDSLHGLSTMSTRGSYGRRLDAVHDPVVVLVGQRNVPISMPASSPTEMHPDRHLQNTRALGPTCDLVLIEGTATATSEAEATPALGDAFAAKAGFDPRALETRTIFRLCLVGRLARREAHELGGREPTRFGRRLVAG